ncbi:hypothetical protein ACFZ8E_19140 [Methylobacterium sp. HMF5984]|uniref:hypothetical protein n=1 Tax=Methylobacterium sp. HMF5984 TaxID=3367370 RepID=UPI00385510F7
MTEGGGLDGEKHPLPATTGDATARFGPPPPPNVNVQVNTQSLHINPSNLAALERIVQLNPAIASEIIRTTGNAARYERDRYSTGAICATVICGILLICAAVVAVNAGFWAGIGFFLACVAAAAVVAAIFTGKVQDLSWTARVIPGSKQPPKPPVASEHSTPPEF